MADSLALLLEDGVIDEIVGRLKSGKEADLYLVRHAGEVVAAKLYKEREARNFRNNAAYKEGRNVRNSRTQRAMRKGSRFGQAAAEEAWKSAEADALYKLHANGVRVPTPVMFYEGVLLMQLVVDAEGQPAPRLIDAPLTPAQAAEIYADLRQQVVRILACDLIHGDLSAYNVLLGTDGPTVIDFPQVIGAAHNSQSERFFRRDLDNIRSFLAGYNKALQGRAGDAREIWRAYERRELSPDFVPTGRVEAERGPGGARGSRPPPGGQGQPRHGRGERRPRDAQRGQGSPRGAAGGQAPRGHGGHGAHGGKAPRGHGGHGGRGAHGGSPGAQQRGQAPGQAGRGSRAHGSGRGRQASSGPVVSYVSRPVSPAPAAPAPPAGGQASTQRPDTRARPLDRPHEREDGKTA